MSWKLSSWTLGVIAGLCAAAPLSAQNSFSLSCPAQGLPNAAISCSVNLTLGNGVQVDALSYNVNVTPSGGAPAATAVSLTDGLGNYDANNGFTKSTGSNFVSIAWVGLSPTITGPTTQLTGTFKFTVPGSAVGGQTYTVNWGSSPSAQCCGVSGTSVNPSQGAAQIVTVPTVLAITSPASGATLPPATAGTAFTTTIATTGGTNPLSYSLTGSWPAGASINSSGVITATFPAAATYSGTLGVSVKDSSNPQESANATYNLTVNAALSNMIDATTGNTTLPTGTQGAAYASGNISVSGGTANYSWSTTTNLATYGLTLNTGASNTVTITGTPSGPVNGLNVSLKVTDANGASLTTGFTLTINGPLTLSPGTALPTATVGTAYSTAAITASGGTAPYTFSATGLPNGLTINAGSGQITGTPSNGANGSYSNIQVTVTDHANSTVTHTFSMTVDLAITLTAPNSIPGGTTGAPYPSGINFSATGGSGTFTWSVAGLPGVSASPASGAATSLSGSPTVASAGDTVTITVTDSNNAIASKTYNNVVIAQGVSITAPAAGALPGATMGIAYTVNITTSGGTSPYAWTISQGSLPTGLSLPSTINSTDAITGTPTGTGLSTFTVKVTDTNGSISTQQYTITVNAPPSVTGPGSLPTATVSSTYTSGATIGETGGTAPLTWTAAPLPNGLSINSSGVISGTPTTNAGSPYTVIVKATDANGAFSSVSSTLTVNPALTITPTNASPLPVGIPTVAYKTTTLTPSGGSGAGYVFTVSGLPNGLSLSAGGVLSGTPSANSSNNYSPMITLTDGIGATRTFQYVLNVAPPLSISGPSSLPAGTVSVAYVQTAVTAAGGSGPYSFSATGLPPGLSISSGGTVSGTPTAIAGSPYSVTVTVTDANGTTATKSYSIIVAALPLQIITGLLPAGVLNAPYPYTPIVAQGGVPPYTWTITGLPPGLSTDGNGDITGTPTSSTGSPFSVVVKVSDATLNSVTRTYSLSVSGNLTVISPTALPAATLNTAYTAAVMAGGGLSPYTWTATGLPAGLGISASSGVISGTPTTAAGSPYSVTVTVTDSTGKTASMTYSLAITSSALTISGPASLPAGTVGSAYTQTTVTATGGSGVYTFAATGLPSGLSIGVGSGVISGTPASGTAGPYTVVVTVTDTNSTTATKSYSLTINPGVSSVPVITSISTSTEGQSIVAPNTWVSVYGSNFEPAGFIPDTWTNTIKASTTGALPIVLDGVSVMVGGVPAYVAYVSTTQINVLTANIGFGPLQVTVTTVTGGTSLSASVTSQQVIPGLFEWPNNQPVATHENYQDAAAPGTFAGLTTVPAAPGETIILWGSGFGPTSPANPFGVAIPATPTYPTTSNVSVMFNNAPLTVYENLAFLTAGSAGLFQVAVTLPATIANGSYPLSVTIGGVSSPPLMLTVAAAQ